MEKLPSVLVAGHICLDILPKIPEIGAELFFERLQPGHLIEVGAATLSTGGPVSNTGLALHKLGISTRLMGKVGTDLFGQEICNILAAHSPELSKGMLVDAASSTSYSVVISPPGVDRIFLHNPGANHTFCAADVNYQQVSHTDLFHFGYPPLMQRMYENDGAELSEIFSCVKALDVLTSLDMAFPDPGSPAAKVNWLTIFQAVLPYVDIFLPSIEELLFCLRRPLYNEVAREGNLLECVTPDLLGALSAELLEMGVKIVVLKLGEQGLYLRTAEENVVRSLGHVINPDFWGGRELWSPCFQVDVVGTTGSGDATIAGFLSGLLLGLSPVETMTMAVAVGACNVEAADALSGIRAWDETRLRIQQGWPRRELHIPTLGWKLLPDLNTWAKIN